MSYWRALKLLLVEDENRLRTFLERAFSFEGYKVKSAATAEEALKIAEHFEPDVYVLDVMLAGDMDGIKLARTIRKKSNTPILMLTALDDVESRVDGLNAGADDYIVKPFAIAELMSRVRAVMRRAGSSETPDTYQFADLELDARTRTATRGGVTFELTAKEYELLELFMKNPRRTLSREEIFERVWEYDFGGESNIIEVYVRYLRQKTESSTENGKKMSRLIHTVRGTGYVLRESDEGK